MLNNPSNAPHDQPRRDERSGQGAPAPESKIKVPADLTLRDLNAPARGRSLADGVCVEHSATEASSRESTVGYLYRGTFQNFGLCTIATIASATVTSLTAAIAAHFGAGRDEIALAATGVSYVWYPIYFGLSKIFHDNKLVQDLKARDESNPGMRLWGSRLTQGLLSESLWILGMTKGQIFFGTHAGMSPGAAALATHLVFATALNVAVMTPIRNLAHWMWGLDGPKRST